MKRNSCFVDTSALIALNDARDQYHQTAREIAAASSNVKWVISDAVVMETYNLLRYRIGFYRAHSFLKKALERDSIHFCDVTSSIRTKALHILEKFPDHSISYCDALSVAMMKEENISKIFAFDYHFEIMGATLLRA